MDIVDLWTLRIEHDYFLQNEPRDFDIRISSEMRILLMRRNLVWRKKSGCEWCLSAFDNYALNDEDVLEVEVVATGNDLPYVTDFDWPVDKDCYEVEIPVGDCTMMARACTDKRVHTRTPCCFMKLRVPMGQIINQKIYPTTTKLFFHCVHKYWEYILLPRQPEMVKNIRLEDTRNSVTFSACQSIDFMGHKACKTRSLEKVPLQAHYPHMDLVVWETFSIREVEKERILLPAIPFPEPSLHLGTAGDTVWRIIYY